MKETSKSYAEALFSLALEHQCVAEYAKKLEEIDQILQENPDYAEYLSTPALPLSERLLAIEEAFGTSMPEHVVSFLKLMCENGHMSAIRSAIKEFFRLELAISNTVTVTVYSGITLSKEQKEKLEQKLEAKYRKHIHAVYREDSSLVGGIKIVMEDSIMDGSIKKRLESIKEVIKP